MDKKRQLIILLEEIKGQWKTGEILLQLIEERLLSENDINYIYDLLIDVLEDVKKRIENSIYDDFEIDIKKGLK